MSKVLEVVVGTDVLNGIDFLSGDSEKRYLEIVEYLKNNDNEDIDTIILDFRYITVVNPTSSDVFVTDILSNKKLKLRMNSDKFIDNIKLLLMLHGKQAKDIEVTQVLKPSERRKLEMEKEYRETLRDTLIIDLGNREYKIDIGGKFDQLHNYKTFRHVENVVLTYFKNKERSKIEVYLGDIDVKMDLVNELLKVVRQLEDGGHKVNVRTEIFSIERKIELSKRFIMTGANEATENERATAVRRSLKPGTAGILVTYAHSRKLDELGRKGGGVVTSTQPAIYQGIRDNKLVFLVCNLSDLTTKEHKKIEDGFYSLMHDYGEYIDKEEYESLDFLDVKKIGLMEIGVDGIFMGNTYHFCRAVHYKSFGTLEPLKCIEITHNNGKEEYNVYEKTLLLPEKMYEVFKDYGIKFDTELLLEDIEKSREEWREKLE